MTSLKPESSVTRRLGAKTATPREIIHDSSRQSATAPTGLDPTGASESVEIDWDTYVVGSIPAPLTNGSITCGSLSSESNVAPAIRAEMATPREITTTADSRLHQLVWIPSAELTKESIICTTP